MRSQFLLIFNILFFSFSVTYRPAWGEDRAGEAEAQLYKRCDGGSICIECNGDPICIKCKGDQNCIDRLDKKDFPIGGSAAPAPAASGATAAPAPADATVPADAPGTSSVDYGCEDALREAQAACDTEKQTGSQVQGVSAGLAEVLNQSGLGVAKACNKVGELSLAANSITFSFQQNCARAQSACLQACNSQLQRANGAVTNEAAGTADQRLAICQGYSQNLQQSQNALTSILRTAQGASHCADQSSDYCKMFPGLSACQAKLKQDCSNPAYAAQNKICTCASGANSPDCLKEQSKLQASVGMNSSGIAATLGKTPSLALSDEEQKKIDLNGAGENGKGEDIGGNKGGRALGAGGGFQGGGNGGRGGGHEDRTSLNNGFFGSSSSLGGFASAVRGVYNKLTGQGGAEKKNGTPDLRQFLPGGKFDPKFRGLAGTAGPDGITGPHSDIWKKIKNRYQAQSTSLIP